MADCLLHEVREGVARLTLNRPQRRNALSRELISELDRALHTIAGDRKARVVVLGGNGPVFSSGHDLAELTGLDERGLRDLFELCNRVMLGLRGLRVPVI